MKNNDAQVAAALFPIVGIGASAGGLVALQQFLSHVAPNCGMAFVVVQHLDPKREGMLVELLQKHSAMPVAEAIHQAPVLPDHVYVIPPAHNLSVTCGTLQISGPLESHGLRLPIDFFFKSLAEDRQQYSIGVILSGMGSDGTQGLRAIRQVAGACFVQTPADAQFDSMPRSAIDAGVADVVASAKVLPLKIQAYVTRVQLGAEVEAELDADRPDNGFLNQVIGLLHAQNGHDFSPYKKTTLLRRIERRMGLHQLGRTEDYLRYLRETPQECALLFNELLIGVTGFFRDAAVWEQIKVEVIPALLAAHPDGAVLRAWVPACSSGEEAYSLAMAFCEVLELARPAQRYSLQIFASDLDKDAIATGRAGLYSRTIAADLSQQRLGRFFVEDPAGYRVCNQIREMVIFAEQNIIANPPFTRLDILSCRNLLIYLEAALQGKLIRLFHYCQSPGGFLVLGSAESINSTTSLYAPLLPAKSRIFRRLDAPARVLPLDFPSAFAHAQAPSDRAGAPARGAALHAPNLQALVESRVLQVYAPAALLVSDLGDIVYVSGKTGKYLEPAPGKPTMNLFAMSRDGLSQALSEAFFRVLREKTPATLKGLKVMVNGMPHYVDVFIEPLLEPAALSGMVMVVLTDVPAPRRRQATVTTGDGARLEALVQELQQAREDAKSTREEMQTSQEELKSTNEELQSANEELQSANEELTTSKEEMQSLNEELQTVNHELQAKLAELSRTSNDMKNLLDSTELATLFLDDTLRVRRFTTETTRIIKLIPADTGRPITDIASELSYPDMVKDAREVLRTLVFQEKDVPATGGRWFKVRTMPYRTQENRIDGLVVTFSDVTASKKLESELRNAPGSRQTARDGANPMGVGDGVS